MPDTFQESRIEADHAEIEALIYRETTCFHNRDFDGWAACYAQTPRDCSVSVAAAVGVTVLRGWEAIRDDMASVLAMEQAPCGMVEFRKKNMQITVDCDTAWVVYDGWGRAEDGSISETAETVILERQSAGWRIAYNGFVQTKQTITAPSRIALDATGHVVWTAQCAEDALRSHPALTVSHGRLRARRADWDKVLQAAIQRAGAVHGFFHHQAFVTKTRAPFSVPIVLGEDETGAAVICSLQVLDGLTYLDLDPTADLDRRLTTAQMVFGLSPGQSALAARIASGESLTDAAATLGISINTARTHLKRIYDKTGVKAQTALVRLLLSVG